MAYIRKGILIRFLRILTAVLMILSFLTCNGAFATSVGNSIVFGIQSSKTLMVRPFEPVERDMLSVYNVIYESLITIDDNYLPQGCLAESWESDR